MARSGEIRLYALDGGTLRTTGDLATMFSDDGAYDGRTIDFPVPCFLIRHPEGDMMWDTGISPRSVQVGAWAAGGWEATPAISLVDQLRELGLAPSDIHYLTLSHSHGDHSGNAGLFARSIWLVDANEREWMFNENRASRSMDDYGALETSTTQLIHDDHDVFGDGSVVIVRAPGHTPGHTVLLVRLPQAGPILFSGDLWHLTESRVNRRVPAYNADRAQTLSSMDRVEALVAATGARVVIQHDRADYEALPRFPTGLQ